MVTVISSGKNRKEVAQIGLDGGIAQKRADAEDLLEGAQGRSVRVADEVLVAVAFGKRRYHDHSDRTVGKFPFVPGDEHRAATAVGRGIEDRGQVLRQPGVALADGI